MFNSTSASAIDPDVERDPPAPATLVYFPQNDLDEHSFKTDDAWVDHIPDLFKRYSRIAKPGEVSLEHIQALNINVREQVDLEDLVPVSNDGHDFLPPSVDPNGSRRNSLQKSATPSVNITASNNRFPLLSNGHKAPDDETYAKYLRELTCDTDDALRGLQKRKPRPGRTAPHISHFRSYWSQLELMAGYWDTSMDHYYEAGSLPPPPQKSPRGLKRLSLALSSKDSDAHKPRSGQRYKGRRISTGTKMPDQFRVDMVRQLIEPIALAFGCTSINPKKVPQLEIASLRLPVTQTAVIWRNSQDKAASKHGITEGPLFGLQCRGETGFVRDKHTAYLDAAREIAGLLLLAEERWREGKVPMVPGTNKWWTSKARWGGGPGGEFGEAEGNKDQPSSAPTGRRGSMPISMPVPKRTEEEIWKELKSGPGLYDPRHTYLAVGKDRAQQLDTVYMVSCLYHHLAILKLTVHPSYIEFLVSGQAPQMPPNDTNWYKPQVERSRWFDMLTPVDRGEAFRGLWGVMSYLMRSGDNAGQVYGQRQKSDSHQHHFSFRRKSLDMTPSRQSQRSHSVAF